MVKQIALFIFILCLHITGSAQHSDKQAADSMLQLVTTTQSDSLKVRLYSRVFNLKKNTALDEARQVANAGLQLAEQLKWDKAIAIFYDDIGQLHSSNGLYDSAIYYFQKAVAINERLNEHISIANNFNNMGVAAQNLRSDYAGAAQWAFKALQKATLAKDTPIQAICLSNISRLYSVQQDYNNAMVYARQSVRLLNASGYIDKLALAYESMANIFYHIQKKDSAALYYDRAIDLLRKTDDIFLLASVMSNKALVLINDYNAVIATRLQAQELFNASSALHISSLTNLGNLGVAYFDAVQYDTVQDRQLLTATEKKIYLKKAAQYLTQAVDLLAKQGEHDTRSAFIGNLAELYAYEGDYKNAYYNYKIYSESQDSVYSQESKNKIAAAASQAEIDKRESALQLAKLKTLAQQKTMWALVAGFILIGIIGFLFYRQSKLRKINNQQLKLLNSQLHEANSAKTKLFAIMSHDLRKPIASLVNFMEIKRNAPTMLPAEQAEQYERKLQDSAESLLHNMEQLLLWSKSQMQQFKPEKKVLLLQSFFQEWISRTGNSTVPVQFFCSPGNISVFTDAGYLSVILQNLISNSQQALKGRADGEITCNATSAGDLVDITVSDNGPGFDLAHLNEKTEIDTMVYTLEKGGLGLPLVKDMCRLIDVDIRFGNNETGGGLVILKIPKGY